MYNLLILIGIFLVYVTEAVSSDKYYCNTRTFFQTEVSVSKNSKFITDLASCSSENISVSSDPDSFKVDVTGCLIPSGLLQDVVGAECQFEYLPTLFAGAVQFLDTLKLIKLENCYIRDVEPGAFLSLSNLEYVSLRFNNIAKISTGIFNDMEIIQLDLSNNKISYIEEGAFDNMLKLTAIRLDRNELKNWYNDWFKNCPNVIHISAAYNHLTVIPAYAFGNTKNHLSATIRLSNNNITFVHHTAFNGLSKLHGLWLDYNNLKSLDDKVFQNFDKIYVLSLAGNKLKCLSARFLYGIKSNDIVMRVEDNEPMDCQCLQRIQDWAENRSYFITEIYAKQECERKIKKKKQSEYLPLQNILKSLT